MKKDKFINNAFELMFSEAAKELTNEAEKLSEIPEEHIFSKEHEKKIEKILKKEKRRLFIKKALKYKGLAAAIIAAAVLAFAAIPNATAIKIIFMNYFFDEKAPGMDIDFSETKGDSYKNEKIILKYIPYGFEVTYEEIGRKFVDIGFERKNEYFSINSRSITGNLNIDIEGAVVEEIYIGNNKGICSLKEDSNIIVWSDGEHALTISGNLEKEELIKIAEGFEYNS